MRSRIALLAALLLQGCAGSLAEWRKPDADATLTALDLKTCRETAATLDQRVSVAPVGMPGVAMDPRIDQERQTRDFQSVSRCMYDKGYRLETRQVQ
jgi:hypothetical protein